MIRPCKLCGAAEWNGPGGPQPFRIGVMQVVSDIFILDLRLYSRSDTYLVPLYIFHIARGAISLNCQMLYDKVLQKES
jgi:hypothetical protein